MEPQGVELLNSMSGVQEKSCGFFSRTSTRVSETRETIDVFVYRYRCWILGPVARADGDDGDDDDDDGRACSTVSSFACRPIHSKVFQSVPLKGGARVRPSGRAGHG